MTTETTLTKEPEIEGTEMERTRSGRSYRPQVDILDRDGQLTLLVDLPGLSINGIDVHFEDGELTIHGRTPPRRTENTVYLAQEYGIGDFHRSFRVSDEIDAANITAQYENGVLQLLLPKSVAAVPRKIKVQGT